ncbi:MAG: hypothetical protein K6G47_03450 [Clostridia bacterium]|nr:hypothetical protein [Clostridia bacterium]
MNEKILKRTTLSCIIIFALMIVRVLIAQLISFGVVMLMWKRRRSALKEKGTVDGTCKNSKQLSIV